MKKLQLLSLLFCYTTLYSQESELIIPDSVLVWNQFNKLNWQDFNGDLDPNVLASAVTSYKIEFIPEEVLVDENDKIQGYEDLTVQARFYKNQSWTVTKNSKILLHEQLHFDIAELFSRKIRKRFTELKKLQEARYEVYWENYLLLWRECRMFQKQYDLETSHGDKEEINKVWQQLVIKELKELEAFIIP